MDLSKPAQAVSDTVTEIASLLQLRAWRLAVAESCTGGLVAAALTALPGSSAWFEYGFVSYANRAKTDLLGVSPALLDAQGAVSEACVRAMAEGARRRAGADWAVAISGVAGPGGGMVDKPVGTVWIAWSGPDGRQESEVFSFSGARDEVRRQAVEMSLCGLLRRLRSICAAAACKP